MKTTLNIGSGYFYASRRGAAWHGKAAISAPPPLPPHVGKQSGRGKETF